MKVAVAVKIRASSATTREIFFFSHRLSPPFYLGIFLLSDSPRSGSRAGLLRPGPLRTGRESSPQASLNASVKRRGFTTSNSRL